MHRLLQEALGPPVSGQDGRRPRDLAAFLSGSAGPPHSEDGRVLAPGETLGRFRIEGELGRGGFGLVYRATDTHLGREVALKIPRPDRVQTVALWDRFAREARLAARLDHEAIVPVLEAGVLDGTFVLVGAYQEGEPLSRWLATRHPAGMPPRLAVSVALRMASGLRHAHEQGVLHRDLKPANVLMVAAPGLPEGWCPRITDFGLGTIHDEAEPGTGTGIWQGSPPYMAPEQVLPGLGRVGTRSDLYALGAILYEMLTGRPIYPCSTLVDLSIRLERGETAARPRQIRPDIPTDLETICLTCLERDPAGRYASAAALHEDLLRFLDGRTITARPIAAWARLRRWAGRRPAHAALVALAIVATATTAGLVARHQRQLGDKNAELARSNARLRAAVVQRDSVNAALRSTFDRLRVSERMSRRTAYAADLRLAGRELEAGRIEQAQYLLRRHEPADGPEELRDFAWYYSMRQATRTYTVRPLKDFLWWRGSPPLSPAWSRLDRWSREVVRNALGNLQLDRDGIRAGWGPTSFRLAGQFQHYYYIDEQSVGLPQLWFNDGRQRTPLDLPANRWQTLSRGGQILAFDGPRETESHEAPPLLRHGDRELPARAATRPTGPASSVRVVESLARSSMMTFSGDNRVLACLARSGGRVRPLIYDLASEWRASYPQHETRIEFIDPRARGGRAVSTRLALSHDGRLAAMSGDPARLRVFETRTGRTLWSASPEVAGADAFVTCMAFSDDGRILATGDHLGRVLAWDATEGHVIGLFPVSVGYVTSIGFHPDDRTIAIIAHDEDAIRLWDHAPRPEPPTTFHHGDEVWGLTFARSGATLVSVGDDNRTTSWDLSTGEANRSFPAAVLQSAVARDPKGAWFAIGDFDGLVTLRRGGRLESATATSEALRGTRIRALAISSADPPSLIAAGSGSRVLVATLGADGKILRERLVETPHSDTYGLALAPDEGTLAMGGHDRVITLWELSGLLHRATLEARAPVTCVAYSPDGRTLVSGDAEGGLQFWDMPGGTLRTTVPHASESGGVWALAFSPDGRTLATGGDDEMVRLWGLIPDLERLTLDGHAAKVHALAFSPDGRTLASGDFTGLIRLWCGGP